MNETSVKPFTALAIAQAFAQGLADIVFGNFSQAAQIAKGVLEFAA